MRLKNRFYDPFPFTRGIFNEIFSVFKVCAIVTIILLFLKPFGLERVDSSVIISFGLVVFFVAIINNVISSYIVKPFINTEKWCIWKEILRSTIYILLYIIAILFFASLKFNLHFNMFTILKFSGLTIFFAFITLSIRMISTNNWQLKNKLEEIKKLSNVTMVEVPEEEIFPIELKSNIVNDVILTNSKELQFIEAEQNYITITELKKSNLPQSKLLRLSMVKALEQIENDYIVRCHRSYIVNLKAVKKVIRNSQGMKLVFNDELKPVPVSRSYKEHIKEKLSVLI